MCPRRQHHNKQTFEHTSMRFDACGMSSNVSVGTIYSVRQIVSMQLLPPKKMKYSYLKGWHINKCSIECTTAVNCRKDFRECCF